MDYRHEDEEISGSTIVREFLSHLKKSWVPIYSRIVLFVVKRLIQEITLKIQSEYLWQFQASTLIDHKITQYYDKSTNQRLLKA